MPSNDSTNQKNSLHGIIIALIVLNTIGLLALGVKIYQLDSFHPSLTRERTINDQALQMEEGTKKEEIATINPRIQTAFLKKESPTFFQGYQYSLSYENEYSEGTFSASGKISFTLPREVAKDLENNNEKLAFGYAPWLEDNQQILFIATQENIHEKDIYSTVSRIYAWDRKTNKLTPVFQLASSPDDDQPTIFGISGSKLVLLFRHPDWSPGPCDCLLPWEGGSLKYLELSDTDPQLKTYSLPTSFVTQIKSEQSTCLQDRQKDPLCK